MFNICCTEVLRSNPEGIGIFKDNDAPRQLLIPRPTGNSVAIQLTRVRLTNRIMRTHVTRAET